MKALYWIIGVVVVAGGAWVALGMPTNLGLGGWTETDSGSNTQNGTTTGSDAPSTENQDFKGSLQELITRGGSWKCDVSVTVENITTTGTNYVGGGKVRADFTSVVPEFGNITSHMIMRENTVYSWSDLSPKGLKFAVENGEVQDPRTSTEATPQFDQAYNYTCSAWPTDESKFELPSGITF